MSDTIPDGYTRPEMADPLINRVLESRYRIDEEVGRGGMGVVYRGTDLTLSRPVAIKTIIHREANEEALKRFINEARTLAQIETPRLVPVYAVGQDEGYHYLVMKFLEGEELADLMKREGTLSVERVTDIITQVCEALHALHDRGIIHRDIKPANLMVAPDGKVTVMDLGIAKVIGEATSSSAMGTPKYMPPEAIDNKALDARADLYSLAIIAYQALCGRVPFDGPTPMSILYMQAHMAPTPLRELAPHLPKSIESVIDKALSKDPTERFQSAQEMAQAFKGERSALQGSTGGSKLGYIVAALALAGLAWTLLRPPPAPQASQVQAQAQTQAQAPAEPTPSSPTGQGGSTQVGAPLEGSKQTAPSTLESATELDPQDRGSSAASNTSASNKANRGTSVKTKRKSQTKRSKPKSSKPKGRLVRVRVASKPSGASIYYQGKKIGKTPETIEKPESESWSLTFKLKGFKSRTKTVAGRDVRVSLESLFGGF